jgi:tRNA-uridine 2-sulfurtransferase
MLTQEQLSRACFPLGEKTKPEVREIARAAGLVTHDRPESQDFAAGGYRAVVDAADRPGAIVDAEGKVIGRHSGYWGYTVGQRKGLGIGGGAPLYVTSIDAATNTLVAGPETSLYRGELVARGVSWAAITPPAEPVRVQVKIRYRNAAVPATATVLDDGRVRIVFDEPQRAVARGQWAVMYDGELVVAGGVIE